MNLIRVAACFSMLAFLPACSHDGDCDIIDVRDYPSPDGSYVLTSFGYTCYDTTGNDMHLQLRRPSDKLSVPGNVCTVLFAGDFSVFWISPTNLSIRVHGQATEPPRNVMGVAVTFTNTQSK